MTARRQANATSGHDHGPTPSYEWIVEGDRATVLSHLRTLAPTLAVSGGHFDTSEMDREERDLPARYTIQFGHVAVGGVDFLPLPDERTLMRLYLCSDLGTTCELDDGDQIAIGFVEVWLNRLQRLGFPAAPAPPASTRPCRPGFVTLDER